MRRCSAGVKMVADRPRIGPARRGGGHGHREAGHRGALRQRASVRQRGCCGGAAPRDDLTARPAVEERQRAAPAVAVGAVRRPPPPRESWRAAAASPRARAFSATRGDRDGGEVEMLALWPCSRSQTGCAPSACRSGDRQQTGQACQAPGRLPPSAKGAVESLSGVRTMRSCASKGPPGARYPP